MTNQNDKIQQETMTQYLEASDKFEALKEMIERVEEGFSAVGTDLDADSKNQIAQLLGVLEGKADMLEAQVEELNRRLHELNKLND